MSIEHDFAAEEWMAARSASFERMLEDHSQRLSRSRRRVMRLMWAACAVNWALGAWSLWKIWTAPPCN